MCQYLIFYFPNLKLCSPKRYVLILTHISHNVNTLFENFLTYSHRFIREILVSAKIAHLTMVLHLLLQRTKPCPYLLSYVYRSPYLYLRYSANSLPKNFFHDVIAGLIQLSAKGFIGVEVTTTNHIYKLFTKSTQKNYAIS